MSLLTRAPRLRLRGARKREVRAQFAALPWRLSAKGKVRVCLITSRRTGRWIVPKGWPMRGRDPTRAVAVEAWEEAGLRGEVAPRALGLFSYDKRMIGPDLPVIAVLYALRVTQAAPDWPERRQRQRRWLSRKKAAALVSDPELAILIRGFAPDLSGDADRRTGR
ncbi:MAG: NUDIX hydrolase [Paracoccaceae bacterium]